jgi:predicted nucleic acid-binding protein
MIVVTDTTALNYLILIGYPSVLHNLFQTVILPAAVLQKLLLRSRPKRFARGAYRCPSGAVWTL